MESLSALVLAAGLVAPSLPPAPVVNGRAVIAAAPVTEVTRLSLYEIVEAEMNGFVDFGGVALSAAFDFRGESWVKVRVGEETKAFALSTLPVDAVVGGRSLRVALAKGVVSAGPAKARYGDLIAALFKAARHVHPHAVLDYAVVAEKGGGMPPSLCLIRKDDEGTFWITYRKPEELAAPSWFAAVNGVLKGMVFEGLDLVFVEKPIEQQLR